MNLLATKIPTIIFPLVAVFFATNVWSATSINGVAEVKYAKHDAEANGSNLFSGNSLVQQYSLEFNTTNKVYRNQPNYYKFMVGYNLVDFSTHLTELTEPTQETTIKQNLGKFKYSGEVSYMKGMPISVKGYIRDDLSVAPRYRLIPGSIIDNLQADSGLADDLTGRQKNIATGILVNFEPKSAGNASLRALPRVFLEYRDSTQKGGDSSYRLDSRSRELAVALNRENNWVHYRLLDYNDFLSSANNLTSQQIQIGLVDNNGKRSWSALTNWIAVSADAQLDEEKRSSTASTREEYDVNFMAIATRQKWNARTFMNYNRNLEPDNNTLTETARVPLYVKGIYGYDTDWYVSMAASRGRESHFPAGDTDTFYTNTLTVGGTTFNRSKFTLSPSLSLQTSKYLSGNDTYTINSALETASTRRFSDELGLGAKLSWRAMDDGSATLSSKSWSSNLDLTATYRPSGSLLYKVRDTIDSGSGYGFIDALRIPEANRNNADANYLRNYIYASAGWTPNARFATSIQGTYDIVTATDLPVNTESSVTFLARYDNQSVSYSLDANYVTKYHGLDEPARIWKTSAQVQYRPDRYSDGVLRGTYEHDASLPAAATKVEINQRYSYKFFSRKGVVRNVATLSEEYSFIRQPVGSGYPVGSSYPAGGDVQYLLLSGRYSPTDRYSLYGSVRYEAVGPNSVTMYYNTGMTADFRLLSTSIDYTLAKRDIDNRIEKKLAASVRRYF